jgi:alpha-beta hydrolase superfamily lysophospholipase
VTGWFKGAVFAILVLAVVIALGPRPEIASDIRTPHLPSDLARYNDSLESRFSDITPGAERSILWYEENQQTALSIVYLHGFSATRAETAPLCDSLARRLRANLFYTRLTGHGRSGQALAEASAEDWLGDMVEAVEIGKRLGEQVILIANSTGAPLVAWYLATQTTDRVLAAVLMSPNFGPKDSRSKILLWPWGGQIARLLVGPTRSWEPLNELQQRFWTTSYPTRALLPMMALVDMAVSLDLGEVSIPVLVLYSPRDQVIDPEKAIGAFHRLGSARKFLVPAETDDPSGHILAGSIISPGTTRRAVETIESFVATSLLDPGWLIAQEPLFDLPSGVQQ